jgi:hypothetical protein
MAHENEYWQRWLGPTGPSGPIAFLGGTGAQTGPAFFGPTGATGPAIGSAVAEPAHLRLLYDRARIRLVGAADVAVRDAMNETFHEFFNDSSCWWEAIPGLLEPGVVYYILTPGNPQSLFFPHPKGRIIGLIGVCNPLGSGVGADMPEPGLLRLRFAPSSLQSVWATVVKNIDPTLDRLPEVPAWVVAQFETWLLAGIIGRLQMHDRRPYSNPQMGPINYQTFRQGVTMARVRMLRRNTFGNAWSYPQEFATRSQHGSVSVGNEVRF